MFLGLEKNQPGSADLRNAASLEAPGDNDSAKDLQTEVVPSAADVPVNIANGN